MQKFLEQISHIQNGTYQIENRIDGQFIGAKHDLLDLIQSKNNSYSLVCYQVECNIANSILQNNAHMVDGDYYCFKEINNEILIALKDTKYIQGIYVFNDNCLFYAEDDLEDITLSLKFCIGG